MKTEIANIDSAAALANMTGAEILRIYNHHAETPVKRFADKKTAIRRTAALLEAQQTAPEQTAPEKAAPAARAPSRSRSEGIRESWKRPDVASKRAERSAVKVDGVEYGSVRKAYDALGLDHKDRIPFRIALKRLGRAEVEGRVWEIVPLNY